MENDSLPPRPVGHTIHGNRRRRQNNEKIVILESFPLISYPIYLLYPQISSPGLFPIKHGLKLQVPSRNDNKYMHAKSCFKKDWGGGIFSSNNRVFANVPKAVPVDLSGRLWRCYSWGSTAAHDLSVKIFSSRLVLLLSCLYLSVNMYNDVKCISSDIRTST